MAPVADEEVLGCGKWCGDNGINGLFVPVAQPVPSRKSFFANNGCYSLSRQIPLYLAMVVATVSSESCSGNSNNGRSHSAFFAVPVETHCRYGIFLLP